jgi:hypothetical protein
MTYFLDFDRTLFDTERALPYLFAKPACAELPEGPPLRERASELDALVQKGTLSFTKGELAPYLFPDAEDFLRTHECVIVTAGGLVWQKMKVESALPDSHTPVLYTNDVPKGLAMQEMLVSSAPPFLFVDDSLLQLDSVAEHTPQVKIFEMRRDGSSGSGKYPVVHSLAELPVQLKKRITELM